MTVFFAELYQPPTVSVVAVAMSPTVSQPASRPAAKHSKPIFEATLFICYLPKLHGDVDKMFAKTLISLKFTKKSKTRYFCTFVFVKR